MNHVINRAMHDPDNFVLELSYRDRNNETTQRVVSPIRYLPGDRLLAFCLCREEPRQFYLKRCADIQLRRAEQYVLPLAAPFAS